jgi:hypothetical protein
MSRIYLIVIWVSILSCSSKEREENTLETRMESFERRGITSDTCSFCSIDGFLMESTTPDIQTKITIDFPVAIVLFDRVKFLHKYERENYDTVMKVFKMKHWGDRNKIYGLYDLYGYYTLGIKPILEDNAVTVIDTINIEGYIAIKDNDKKYIIDLGRYRQEDGVLVFTPGKRPIYWTIDKEDENCYAFYGFPKWYFNCR